MPGAHLDQQLLAEAAGRPFEIIAGDRDAAQQRIAADPEQRPADLLPLLARIRCVAGTGPVTSTPMIMKPTK